MYFTGLKQQNDSRIESGAGENCQKGVEREPKTGS